VNDRVAFRSCEQITRARARNFYYGIRLLPPHKREAMCAVYAFARRVDDVADGPRTDGDAVRRLAQLRDELEGVSTAAADPVVAGLAHVRARFPLPMDAFGDLIDGALMDADGARYEAFHDLERYCRRVAGSIGRISVSIFDSSDPERAARLADDLGVAMQLTNILRDVREDRGRGRLYLPHQDLSRFGCLPDPALASPDRLASLIRYEAGRAEAWFSRGLALVPLLDQRSAACVSAMTGIYRRILDRLAREPQVILRQRVSLPAWEKAWVAARSLTGVGA
jgi:15-cis-phytoene synthase